MAHNGYNGRFHTYQGPLVMITVTPAAATKLTEILKSHSESAGVRVGVRGGGCSGFKYFLEVEPGPEESDKILTSLEVPLFIDKKSYLYLMGTEIDYVDTLQQSGFKFVNPVAKRTCGCGESFSI